ncbi:hypothetical protein EYW49_15755 [Siculibacillus lacustris]|uniref:Pyrroline-5-carboxylate reductase catalytic N-terminal domain-containing protein n=1 Tax=Siculibacillus lacustris TaxID=1549641 RepID=A0A4Q9VLJ7_9HYPH|nr:NAD(P)-binding domain-containing protein [Siculibacillus lacustris]TBW35481.1 hypothetical protein EYW49_15755 [Siculibacillus lacustris]
MVRLGIIGVGTLAEAVVEGLLAIHGDRLAVVLSPRSEATSAALAARHGNVTRASSNRAVAADSDVVLLAVRPPQLAAALDGVVFRSDQIVVSFLAGVPLAHIVAAVAPATRVCRVNPLPPIRLRRGPNMMYPSDPVVEDLFRGLGDLLVGERESDIVAIANASALMSTHYQYQNTIVAWLESRGLSSDTATLYVRSMFDGLAAIGLEAHATGEKLDPAHHETKGGLNERGRRHLNGAGWFEEVTRTLDLIEAHVLVGAKPAERA